MKRVYHSVYTNYNGLALMGKSTVLLKVERFRTEDEEYEFRVPSEFEKYSILKQMLDRGTLVALYYDGHHKFVLTNLLAVDDEGMWLDFGPFPLENETLLKSDKIIFVSAHNNAKVQFVLPEIEEGTFDDYAAFYVPMPDYLLRVQRRGWFRVNTPEIDPIQCVIPIPQPDVGGKKQPALTRTFVIADIGWEGVGLRCEMDEADLVKGKVFKNCRIELPEIDTLEVDLEVKSSFTVTMKNGTAKRHVGCMFLGIDNRKNALLQRYIFALEREERLREKEEEEKKNEARKRLRKKRA